MSSMLTRSTLWSCLLLTASCGSLARDPDFYDAFFENEPPPLYEGLGASGHTVTGDGESLAQARLPPRKQEMRNDRQDHAERRQVSRHRDQGGPEVTIPVHARIRSSRGLE